MLRSKKMKMVTKLFELGFRMKKEVHIYGTEDSNTLKFSNGKEVEINRKDDSWTAASKILEALDFKIVWDKQVE